MLKHKVVLSLLVILMLALSWHSLRSVGFFLTDAAGLYLNGGTRHLDPTVIIVKSGTVYSIPMHLLFAHLNAGPYTMCKIFSYYWTASYCVRSGYSRSFWILTLSCKVFAILPLTICHVKIWWASLLYPHLIYEDVEEQWAHERTLRYPNVCISPCRCSSSIEDYMLGTLG